MRLTLAGAVTMDSEKVTDRYGQWYLRQWHNDECAVRLVSARAPAGMPATALQPECVELENDSDDETLSIAVEDLRAFTMWPPR